MRRLTKPFQRVIAAFGVAWTMPAFAEHAYMVPFVPSAENSAQQGFVRILNQTEESGDVRVTPIDDAGRRYPPITIHLDPWAAAHFNSRDLEDGNTGKGLSRGVGPGTGDWRLEVEADFLFEALAYVRTHDGFVTSVFEAANWWDDDIYWVPFFNPGSNTSQVSKLRLVNPKNETATVVIHAVDDRGERAPEGHVELSLAPRSSRMLTAQDLEYGADGLTGRLGDGSGKWRFWVQSDRRLHVLSLLESPTGNITNLSTGAWWNRTGIPLVLPASNSNREGFMRIINSSGQDGDVMIRAVDDDGKTYGPITLHLRAFAAANFNSTDLAEGNSGKGLPEGIGAFEGDLQLHLESQLIVTPLAYVRTADGFVTSVHDLVPTNAVDSSLVSFVNPGSNANQQSLLRIINPTGKANSVEISGRDDSGNRAPGGTLRLSLPPFGARTLTAQELEQGGDGLTGQLGDGSGKWALLLSSDEAIHAMSLLNSPTGNLTNLSATPWSQRLRITNAPVAHDISLSTSLDSPYIDVQLMASDPDGDRVWFWLDGSREGEGYSDAQVDLETGALLATLQADVGEAVKIPFRATDGNEWSDRAFITITIEEDSGERGLGADDIDPRDYANLNRAYFDDDVRSDFEDGAKSLPRSIDLSGNFPVPGNQGRQGSCVGWAVSYLKSYQERLEERWEFSRSTRFSPAWIYNQINDGRDGGSHPLEAMRLIQSSGAATLATMPYDPNDYLTQPGQAAINEARNFLGGDIKIIDSINQYKRALAHRVPFVLGIPTYPSLDRLRGANAVYNDLSGANGGGHAVVVVGYDDDRFGGAFRVLNSWGRGWGDRGFFWIPYDTFRDARFSGAYAITIEDRTNGNVPRPATPPRRSCGAADEPLPNLVITEWKARYQPVFGGEGRLQYRVVNNGSATAPADVDVNLMLSPDRDINGADHWVVYEEIPFELEPDTAAYRDADNELTFTFPQTIPPGTYYMAMWVDDVAEVRECYEDDNISIGNKVVDLQSSKPDLTPTSWYASWDSAGNGTLEYQVTNIGATATTRTDWRLSLELHSDPSIEYGSRYTLFAEEGNFLLDPNDAVYRDVDSAAQFNVLESPDHGIVPVGTYYLTFWVDEFDVVDESNELNNQSRSNSLVTIRAGRGNPERFGSNSSGTMVGKLGSEADRERFNGNIPPEALTRRVQIVETGEGVRRVNFLDDNSDPERGLRIDSQATQPQRLTTRSERNLPILPKQNVSADIYAVPIRNSRPMPSR